MTPYEDTMSRLRERKLRVVLSLINKISNDFDENSNDKNIEKLKLISSLFKVAFSQQSTPEAEFMVSEIMIDLPPEPTGRPVDGVGYITISLSYEPIDRRETFDDKSGFRVMKIGNSISMITKDKIMNRLKANIESVFEKIKIIEIDNE